MNKTTVEKWKEHRKKLKGAELPYIPYLSEEHCIYDEITEEILQGYRRRRNTKKDNVNNEEMQKQKKEETFYSQWGHYETLGKVDIGGEWKDMINPAFYCKYKKINNGGKYE